MGIANIHIDTTFNNINNSIIFYGSLLHLLNKEYNTEHIL